MQERLATGRRRAWRRRWLHSRVFEDAGRRRRASAPKDVLAVEDGDTENQLQQPGSAQIMAHMSVGRCRAWWRASCREKRSQT
jgi:hypothetical protein